MQSPRIRLFLLDGQRLFLDAFARLLSEEPDVQVTGTSTESDTAWLMVLDQKPDLVVMDVDVPGQGAFALAADVAARQPESRVLFLASYLSDVLLDQALRVRAAGYVLKSEDPAFILAAIHQACSGGMCFSAAASDRLDFDVRRQRYAVKSSSYLSTLTNRQLDVLRHLARGESVKSVARTMVQSERAIESQKYRIMQQLGIHDRVELARFAIREGLTVP